MEDEEAVWCVLGGGEVSPHVAICPAGKYAPPPSPHPGRHAATPPHGEGIFFPCRNVCCARTRRAFRIYAGWYEFYSKPLRYLWRLFCCQERECAWCWRLGLAS